MQFMEAMIFLVRTLMGLYVSIVLLRFLFQLARADFYNPFSQAIVKLTSPIVVPMRRVLPSIGRLDTSTVVLAMAVQMAMIIAIFQMRGIEASVLDLVVGTMLGLVHQILDIYTIALFIVVILSWVAPASRNPGAILVHQLTEPLVRPVRNALPPLGGLDFSVMIVLLGLYILSHFIIPLPPV